LILFAGAAGTVLRREVTLWRWRHGHPARVPLRLAVPDKKAPRMAWLS
jgi:hypothetical protein